MKLVGYRIWNQVCDQIRDPVRSELWGQIPVSGWLWVREGGQIWNQIRDYGINE